MASVQDRLTSEVAFCLGHAVTLRAAAGGAGNLAFEVHDLNLPGAPVAFLRAKMGDGGLSSMGYSLAREAAIIQHAATLGFPVADVLGVFDEPDSILMGVVPGTSRPDRDEIEIVGPKYLAMIASLHSADATSFPVVQHDTMREAMEADLLMWTREGEQRGVLDDPMLALTLRVLRHLMPESAGRPSVVHGDVGAGNFMCLGGEVTAMLDWELAHLGDPHEDLAWLWMRGAHTDFGDPEMRFADYERASGQVVDRARLDWQVALVMWKSVLSLKARLKAPQVGELAMIQNMAALTYDALLGSQLVQLLGGSLPLSGQTPLPTGSPEVTLAEELLAVATLTAEQRVVVEYLHDAAAQGPWERRSLQHDCATLLGIDTDSLSAHIATCTEDSFLLTATVLARNADRRSRAMPKAVRRIERAQRIGLGCGGR
jgi:aminoglycoside phosphotransferase (APT) family kinase protein